MNSQQSNGLWYLGAGLVAAILGILGWFLLISPELDAATVASENTDIARDQNDLLELQIARMQALEEEAPLWREEIAKISMDLPPMPEEPDTIRLLVTTLEDAELPVTGITYGRPVAIVPNAESALPAETEATEQGAEESDAAATPTATPETDATASPAPTEGDAAPAETMGPAFAGLYGMQVTFQLNGAPETILDVLNTLATQNERFFTISSLNVTGAGETEGTDAQPALTEDDWSVQVTGLVFSLTEDGRTVPSDEEGSVPEFSGSAVDNVFAPLSGTAAAE
ncbi:hypothetical protein [Demequina sp. NBRC 110051]|uniref:hypothetical protein n=1 Tax=Demequina sp. NBRC 110051 TaxID=1570340 RepID=UPI0009FDFA64|nr:hypothetical protein [Demequina sp. NBRC 110051]